MKKLVVKFRGAYIGWRTASMFNTATFTAMGSIMEMLLKVAKAKRPMMCKMAIVAVGEHHDICAIWAGPTVDSSPYQRIDELLGENAALREELSGYINARAKDRSGNPAGGTPRN